MIADINGEEVKFLIEKDFYDKYLGKKSMNIKIKKGSFGIFYGINLIGLETEENFPS